MADDHLGMGIPVSHILCKKHGGNLLLSNASTTGAFVTAIIEIKK